MVSTTDVFTENRPISPVPYVTAKNPSERKSLHKFTQVLDVKYKNFYLQVR